MNSKEKSIDITWMVAGLRSRSLLNQHQNIHRMEQKGLAAIIQAELCSRILNLKQGTAAVRQK